MDATVNSNATATLMSTTKCSRNCTTVATALEDTSLHDTIGVSVSAGLVGLVLTAALIGFCVYLKRKSGGSAGSKASSLQTASQKRLDLLNSSLGISRDSCGTDTSTSTSSTSAVNSRSSLVQGGKKHVTISISPPNLSNTQSIYRNTLDI